MGGVQLRSWCKVNLCLEILERRDDGFHELRTVFQSVSLGDTLSIETAASTAVTVPEGGAPEGPANLCWQAIEAYRERRGWPAGARVQLHKRVPSGAGLGGGSSNAAATLCGLAELDDDPPSAETIRELAAGLGSDVAFFVAGGTALGSGRGEELQALPGPRELHLVLARPELSIGTAEAYGLLEAGDFSDGSRTLAMADALRRGAGGDEIAEHVHNAFTRAVAGRWPAVAETIEALSEAGAIRAEMSGSGSVCFGLFGDAETAAAAANELRRQDVWATAVRGVATGWDRLS